MSNLLKEAISFDEHGLSKAELGALGDLTVEEFTGASDRVARCKLLAGKWSGLKGYVTSEVGPKVDKLMSIVAPSNGATVVTAQVTAAVSESAPSSNPWESYLSGANSSGLNPASYATFRVAKDYLDRMAKATTAFIILGTGADLMFRDGTASLEVDSLMARDKLYKWSKDARSGRWFHEEDLRAMFTDMPDLFGNSWSQIMDTSSTIYNVQASQAMLGGAGQFGLGQNAANFGALPTLIPATAEHMSRVIKNSQIPVVASDAIAYIEALMDLLRMPELQASKGIVNATPDEGAILFLQKALPRVDVANAFRLATVAESLVRMTGECPQVPDMQFLQVYGRLAAQHKVLYGLVVAQPQGGGQVAQATSFQPQGSVAPVETKRWIFQLNLKFSVSFDRK